MPDSLWTLAASSAAVASLWSVRNAHSGQQVPAANLPLHQEQPQIASKANTDQSIFGYAPEPAPEGLYHTAALDGHTEAAHSAKSFSWRPAEAPEHSQTFRTRIPAEWVDSFVDEGFVLINQLLSQEEVSASDLSLTASDSVTHCL